MRRSFIALLAVSALVGMSGCASTVPSFGIAISVSNTFSSIQAGSAPVTLKAAIENRSTPGSIAWGISVAGTPCSPQCGTLTLPDPNQTFTIVYTPPATAPLNQSATITAALASDRAVAFVFNFTIIPGTSVTIDDKFMSVFVSGTPVALSATVHNDSSGAGVTWTLTAGGTSCSPACGTLTPGAAPTLTATYLPPAVLPTGANDSPTITATSVTKTSASDSFQFTINSATTLFKGSFAFLVRGYDLTGSPMAMAGSITADGNGNITAGNLDINNGGGITAVPTPISGTYTVNPSFHNVVHGTFTITSFTFPNSPNHISLSFVISADGSHGKIVELDGIGYRNVGTIQLQDPSALSAAKPAGTYAFGLDSDAPVGGRTVEAGQFVLTSNGVTSGLVDASRAADLIPRYSATPLASGPATSPDSSGRGTLTLNIPATASGPASSTLYAYYIVNSGQLNLIQIQQDLTFGMVQAGVARLQKPLTANSVNSLVTFQMTGMDAVPGTANGIGPDVIVGLMLISGGTTCALHFDANDLGTIKINQTFNCTVAFDPTTGRGIITVPGGFQGFFMNSATFYLYDVGQGFIIDSDPSTSGNTPPPLTVTNNAFSGYFLPQAGGPFNAQTLSGNALFSSGGTAIPAIPNIAAALNFTGAAMSYTAAGDFTDQDPTNGNLANVSFSGTYSFSDQTLGHGTILLPQQIFGNLIGNQLYPASFYIIGHNQFVAIGVQNGVESSVAFSDPE